MALRVLVATYPVVVRRRGCSERAAVRTDGFRVHDAHLAEQGLVREAKGSVVFVHDVAFPLDLVAFGEIEDAVPAPFDSIVAVFL